jgi:hypothetical protein
MCLRSARFAASRRPAWLAAAPALVLALLALLLAARLTPAPPPIYDGCLATPYRELGANPAPGSGTESFGATATSPSFDVSTSEQPSAQAAIQAPEGLISSPASSFIVSIEPVRPPAPAPPGKRFDGNVYRIVAETAAGRSLEPNSGTPGATIILRATASNGAARTIAHYQNGAWHPLATAGIGCANGFTAQSQQLGNFVLVVPAASPPRPSAAPPAWIIALMSAALLAAVVTVLLRLGGVQLRRR